MADYKSVASWSGGEGGGGVAAGHVTFPISIVPDGIANPSEFAPAAVTMKAIKVWGTPKPVTAGTYTLAVTGAGNNLLAAATFDLTSIDDDTLTDVPLTLTLEDRELAEYAEIEVTVTSDNIDLAASSLKVFGYWE